MGPGLPQNTKHYALRKFKEAWVVSPSCMSWAGKVEERAPGVLDLLLGHISFSGNNVSRRCR